MSEMPEGMPPASAWRCRTASLRVRDGWMRGLIGSLPLSLLASLLATLGHASAVMHAGDVGLSGRSEPSPILQRFLALADVTPASYRALRQLDAHNDHFNSSAWMDVWTEVDRVGGFRYEVVAGGGSPYIRAHVFIATLETERKMWALAAGHRIGLTSQNYLFEDRGEERDGLAWLTLKPRRKDALLVDGSIFVRPDTGDLVRVEGRLAKSPSPWTRHVDIVRSYRRVAGVRMPVALESVATLLVAGRSTFRMTYEYETVNGHHVGNPRPRTTALH